MSHFDNFQQRAIDWCSQHDRGWIAMQQGLGKSRVFIKAAEPHLPAEIICPAHLQKNWEDEIQKWLPGARTQRLRTNVGYDGRSDFYILSYNIAHTKQPIASIKTLGLDEAHYAKSPKAQRSKAVRRHIKDVHRSWFLTGTPMPNRPAELWLLANAIGMTRMTYREWGFHYCAGKLGHWGGLDFRGASHVEELAALWQKYAFRLTKDEVGGLPDKLRRLVVVGSNVSAHERIYDVGALRRNPNPVAFVGLSELLHEHGVRKLPAALDHLETVLGDEQHVLVACRHLDVVQGVVDWCAKNKITHAAITGNTPSALRDGIKERFQAGKIRVLVGNGAMREGLTLTRASYGINVEAESSYFANEQMEDRLHRIGQEMPVRWDYIVADRSIDAAIVEATMFKRDTASRVTGDDWRATLHKLCYEGY